MKLLNQVRRCLVAGAMLGLLIPHATFAGSPNHNSPVRDVALHAGGTLRGAILSAQGQSATGCQVSLVTDQKLVATAVIGTDGKFVIGGLRPGVYSVVAGEGQSTVIRLWSKTAAPPAATPELLLVEHQPRIVRGVRGGFLPHWEHPFLVGGLLITAGVIGGVIGYNLQEFDSAS